MMRHESFARHEGMDSLDVAAVWPAAGQIAPAAIPDIASPQPDFMPTPAAPDIPAAVGAMIAASYAAVIGALFFATAGSAFSIFMITISALFVVTFFTVPRIFFGIEPKSAPRAGFDKFMRQGVETLTGHSSGRDALVQMLIVPVFLALGLFAIGIATAFIL